MVPGLSLLVTILLTFPHADRPLTNPLQRYEAYRPAQECQTMTEPEPVDSPNPVFDYGEVTVDFIVGWNGKVYSPFILESSGKVLDARVLRVLNSWRFHPATCNGIPVDYEGKIMFTTAE